MSDIRFIAAPVPTKLGDPYAMTTTTRLFQRQKSPASPCWTNRLGLWTHCPAQHTCREPAPNNPLCPPSSKQRSCGFYTMLWIRQLPPPSGWLPVVETTRTMTTNCLGRCFDHLKPFTRTRACSPRTGSSRQLYHYFEHLKSFTRTRACSPRTDSSR